MSAIEVIMPYLALVLLLGTAVSAYFCFRVERRLSGRKRINLNNYKENNNLFYITRDVPIMVVAAALAVASLALLIVAAVLPVSRYYVIPFALTLAASVVVAWLSFSREKCARDLHEFDAYYVRVSDLLRAKTRLEGEIGVCRRRAEELRNKLEETLSAFNRNLSSRIDENAVASLFLPLDEMLSEYLRDIAAFSREIEREFDSALKAFLYDGTEPELNILPLRTFDESVVDDLLASIKTSFGTQVTAQVIEEVTKGAVRSAASLCNIMNLLHGLEVRIEKDVLMRFIAVAAQFDDRETLAQLLHKNKQIPAAMLRESMQKDDAAWLFVPGMSAAYGTRDLLAILTDLIRMDLRALCQNFLDGIEATALPMLRDALAQASAGTDGRENATARLVRGYCLILENGYAVGNSASLFEDLALMLFEHGAECGLDDAEQARVAQILRRGEFLPDSRDIATLYQKASAVVLPLAESTMRLLLYFLGTEKGPQLLRADRLAGLLNEYRVTLSANELDTLRYLLAAVVLRLERDAAVCRAVYDELMRLPVAFEIPSDASAGRAIIAQLTQTRLSSLRAVICRTEVERQTLDLFRKA